MLQKEPRRKETKGEKPKDEKHDAAVVVSNEQLLARS